jgi:hypothetical protein
MGCVLQKRLTREKLSHHLNRVLDLLDDGDYVVSVWHSHWLRKEASRGGEVSSTPPIHGLGKGADTMRCVVAAKGV